MARFETLTCDKVGCSEEAVTPTHGWISTAATRGSNTEPETAVKCDFHSVECLVEHFGQVVIQEQLGGLMDAAAESLDQSDEHRDDPRGAPRGPSKKGPDEPTPLRPGG